MFTQTHSKATRSDARDVGILGLGEIFLKVGRDQDSRKDSLIVPAVACQSLVDQAAHQEKNNRQRDETYNHDIDAGKAVSYSATKQHTLARKEGQHTRIDDGD